MAYENYKWGEFERVALSPDDSEREKYLKNLVLNFPKSYSTILGNVYSTYKSIDWPPAVGFREYTNEEKEKISSFFHKCVDHVFIQQANRQNEFIDNKYNEVYNSNDPAELEDIKFRLNEYFIIPSNRPNGCFSLFDPINLRDNENELAVIDGYILRKDESFEKLERYITGKIESLEARGNHRKHNPVPSPREDKDQTTTPNTKATEAPKLEWTANKNHLNELIYALEAVKALKTHDGKSATITDIFRAFNVIGKFKDGKRIDGGKQIYKQFKEYIKTEKVRIKGITFTDRLKTAFIDSLQAEIEEEIRTIDSKN